MEVENSPTLEELAGGNGAPISPKNGHNGDSTAAAADDGTKMMPSPAVLSEEQQRLHKKARRLIRTGSREGHPNLVIPGQATAFIAPQRR